MSTAETEWIEVQPTTRRSEKRKPQRRYFEQSVAADGAVEYHSIKDKGTGIPMQCITLRYTESEDRKATCYRMYYPAYEFSMQSLQWFLEHCGVHDNPADVWSSLERSRRFVKTTVSGNQLQITM